MTSEQKEKVEKLLIEFIEKVVKEKTVHGTPYEVLPETVNSLIELHDVKCPVDKTLTIQGLSSEDYKRIIREAKCDIEVKHYGTIPCVKVTS